jgi:hypothetical protein
MQVRLPIVELTCLLNYHQYFTFFDTIGYVKRNYPTATSAEAEIESVCKDTGSALPSIGMVAGKRGRREGYRKQGNSRRQMIASEKLVRTGMLLIHVINSYS